jgi:hypothetical protein
VSPISTPPADLDDFPTYTVTPSHILFRIHGAARGPWWFSHSGQMRFDLVPPHGTCYLAESAAGAFVEAFQGLLIPRGTVDRRRLSRLGVPRPMTLADCTQARARSFGITGEIHSSDDRATTQAWAAAFHGNGFDGVRYLVRHDPSQQRAGVALFGDAGEADWGYEPPEAIGDELIERVAAEFGIRVI